jgi:signal transduction histidine kinase
MPGREQQPTREQPRLVAQPDGYADYVEDVEAPGQNRSAGNARKARNARNVGKAGNARNGGDAGTGTGGGQVVGPVPQRHAASAQPRRRRQRSIRSTVSLLLIIPLVTLIGLLAYSFATTIPEVLADRSNTTINNEVGEPMQGLLAELNTEAALTYSLNSFPAKPTPAQEQQMAAMPRSQRKKMQAAEQAQAKGLQQQLQAQRPKTDAAIEAYQQGQAKLDASNALPAQDRPLAAALLTQLKTVPGLRTEAGNHNADPLTVFQGYLTVIGSIFPYAGALPNTHSPVPMFSQSLGTLFMGQALTDVSTEADLGNGALENGGVITAPVYQLFEKTVAAQRQLDQNAATMLEIQNTGGTDPYVEALNSPPFKSFTKLEDKIIANGPNSVLPADAQSWGQQTQAALGLLTQGETTERTTVTNHATRENEIKESELFGVGGVGLLLVLISSLLLLRFGNRLSRELQGLRGAVQGLAYQRLPGVVSRLRVGEDMDPAVEAPPLYLGTKTLEVTETAEAFSQVQRTAVQAAIEQAMLRKAVSNVFRRLARRNQGLLQRQLKMLDEMERGTHDPDALGQLFRLDHLTTRMRRQAEGLIILSGAAPGRGWRQPVQVVEVLRGAIGEIEDYVRVDLVTDSPDYLQGTGVADVTHLLAELIENAVTYSPPATRVQVRGGRVANGYVVEVEDRGLGIPSEVLEALNQRLAEPPDFDVADSDQLGLFVVSRLAARHGIKVSLRPSSYDGTTAIVLLPKSLVVTQEEAAYLASQEQSGARARQTGPIGPVGPGSSRGGRMAAAVGAAADALSGKRRRYDTGPLAAGLTSGPMPVLDGPVLDGSALDGTPPLPSRADRPAGASFPGSGGFPRATGSFTATPGAQPGQGTQPGQNGTQASQGTDPNAGEGPLDLPRRQRMASLAPQLQEERPSTPRGPLPGKSPEQARALLSSIQRGLRTGRNTNVGNGNVSDFDGRERR